MKSVIMGVAMVMSLAAAMPAAALQNTVTEMDNEVSASDSGWIYRTFEREGAGTVSVVYTADATMPGAMFTCSEAAGLGVALATRPLDFLEAIEGGTNRARSRTVRTTIGDREPITDRWTMLPVYGTVEPRKASTRRALYNAVVRGQSVTLEIDARPDTTITFPEINSSFVEFASTCPVTSGGASTKDEEA